MSKGKIAVLASVLFLAVIAGYLWQGGFLSRGVPPEKITFGSILRRGITPFYIAEHQGYFKEHGLEVILKPYPTGVDALRDLRAGRIDLAGCAEFGLVGEIFAGAADLRCLAVISLCNSHELIARRDRSINRPEDLRGKTIGVPRGTNAEFFLGRFLTFNKLSLGDIEIVNLPPFAMAEALVDGKVDAVMAWDPYSFEIMQRLGDKVVSWPGEGGQPYFWLLVSTDKFIKARPRVAEELLRALHQAELFLKSEKKESIAIVATQLGIDPTVLNSTWSKYSHELSFDQSLIIAMEDEARWMIHNKLTDQTQLPDFLDYLDPAPLMKVDPKAVRLMVPAQELPK